MQCPKFSKALLRASAITLAVVVLAIGSACGSSPSMAPGTSVLDATPLKSTTSSPSRTPTPPPLEEAGFGGMFVDPDDNSILYIYLVNPSQAAAETAAVRCYGHNRMQNIKEIRPLQAQYTLRQLSKWYNNELLEARPFSLSEVTLTDLDEGQNRIEVGVACESDLDRVREELQKRLTSLGVPPAAVIFTVRARAYPTITPSQFECIPPETVDPATGLSTPGFAGFYVDSGIAYIYLLKPSQEVAQELVLTQLGRKSFEGIQEVRALQGQYTWTQLLEWYESIEDDVRAIPFAEGLSVDPRKNRLTIEVRKEHQDATEREVKGILSRYEVPYEAVILLAY